MTVVSMKTMKDLVQIGDNLAVVVHSDFRNDYSLMVGNQGIPFQLSCGDNFACNFACNSVTPAALRHLLFQFKLFRSTQQISWAAILFQSILSIFII